MITGDLFLEDYSTCNLITCHIPLTFHHNTVTGTNFCSGINKFKSGTATEAQEWLEQFERACTYGMFTDQEKLDELDITLEGPALKRFTRSPAETRSNWTLFGSKISPTTLVEVVVDTH